MKRIFTIAFLMAGLFFAAPSADAKPPKKYNKPYKVKKNKHYNRRVVHTYYQTRTVWYHGRKYRKTYKVYVYRNGRTYKELVNVVKVKKKKRFKVYYKTKTVWKYGRKYRATYKIKKYRNGKKVVKLIKLVPIRHYRY